MTFFYILKKIFCKFDFFLYNLSSINVKEGNMKSFMRFILRVFFRILKIKVVFDGNIQDIPKKGIYICNHVSYLDPLVLFAFLPGNPFFAVHGQLYRHKIMRFFMKTADVMPVNFMDPLDVKNVIAKINEERLCVIFPEGRMTDNGALMKIYEAPCLVADKTQAPLIPVWIDGLQFSYFSNTKGKLPHRLFPETCIRVGTPVYLNLDEQYRTERDYLRNQVYSLMQNHAFKAKFNKNISLFGYLMKCAKIYGKSGLFTRPCIIEDLKRTPQTYKDLIIKIFCWADVIVPWTKKDENVALLLPNSLEHIWAMFALSAYDRTPVHLNYSVGQAVLKSMCQTAQVKRIITSEAFVNEANLQEALQSLQSEGIQVLYTEEISKKITPFSYMKAFLKYKLKKVPCQGKGYQKAIILFTSGSEGVPKAVVLSHASLIANVLQLSLLEVLHSQDLLFNSLPLFHSMGLTMGFLFPIFQGAPVFLFPSPLKHRVITELLYELGASVMMGTDTFYRAYAKISHPYDFRAMRLCYAGAEAVKPETRQLVLERLGVRLMEAYGSTECSPVVTGNNTIFNKFGTVGQVVAGMTYKVIPVSGVDKGGELCVKGPNVMLGYMYHDNPGIIVPPEDGWYHTGDVVEVDEIGFVKIKDRIKRFAKIGGEMISLTLVESLVKKTYYDQVFVCTAVALPHPTKGEQIVLVAEIDTINLSDVKNYLIHNGFSLLYLPSMVVYKKEIPVLGTGKRDFIGLKKWLLTQSVIG